MVPMRNTLFFAGEAAETEGFAHGAIRSGLRAAKQIRADFLHSRY